MEDWEAVFKSCSDEIGNDPNIFAKVLRTAEIVLAEDLAPFETEWIVSSLLNEPVQLLGVVAARRTDGAWATCVRDALKLLASTVSKHQLAEKFYDDIVELCLLHYAPLVQQAALGCLAAVAKRSASGARGLARHLAALEETTTCKAPAASLIGVICEHHPSAVEDEATRIWRVFLNLLDSNKYSVTVTKAVLEGVLGLFTHFGAELPTRELNVFYDKLVNYLEHPKCEAVALQLFAKHASLFRERVAGDARVRALAWRCDAVRARPAVLALYGAVLDALGDGDALQKILESEVLPRTRSQRFYERYTALRVCALAGSHSTEQVDVRALQYRVRAGHVDLETCEAVCWCIHARAPFSECVLQAAILCYDHFPANKRKEVVVHSLLKANAELRTNTVMFLIAESIRAARGAEWLRWWLEVFDSEDGRDVLVAERGGLVLDDVLDHVTDVMESFVLTDEKSLPEALGRLLSLLLVVLRANPAHTVQRPLLTRALRQCARTHALATPAAILLGLHLGEVYEDLPLHACADEAMLLQFSEVLLCAPDTVAGKCLPRDMVAALEIIFSSTDIDPAALSRGVQLLDTLLMNNSFDNAHSDSVQRIIQNVVKLSQCVAKKNKLERILHWDIVMFLGKHGQKYVDQSTDSVRMLVYNLQKTLVLDIPHDDGSMTLNLQALLYSAIRREDCVALNMLLDVITANLSKSKEQKILQTALMRVVLSLSHCSVDSERIRAAVSLCDADCAIDLFKYAVLEKSSRSRKLLLEATEALLQKDGQILENICEYCLENENLMNQSTDTAVFILNQLKENNALCHKLLRTFIDKMLVIEASCDVIRMATDLYLDKCSTLVEDLPRDIIYKLDSTNINDVTKSAVVVEFVKRILEVQLGGSDIDKILAFILGAVENCNKNKLTVFMAITEVFGAERINKVLLEDIRFSDIINSIFCEMSYLENDNSDFLQTKLDFFHTYSDAIQRTGKQCRIKESELTIQNIIKYGGRLTKFLSDDAMSDWFTQQPIQDITRSIERYDFKAEHEECLRAMRAMLSECKRRNTLPCIDVKGWSKCVALLSSSGYAQRNLAHYTAYLMDLLAVSFDYLSDEQIFAITNEGECGLQFLRSFMPAVFARLTKEPYAAVRGCFALVQDVVKYAARTGKREQVLELVDKLWPVYAEHSTTEQQLAVLSDLRPLPAHSCMVRWTLDAIECSNTRLQHKIMLLDVLPNDIKYSLLAATLGPHLPARLGELADLSASAFHALLDALADAGADSADTLLDTVVTLAAGDNEKGWWDDALDACMSCVARRADACVCRAVYARCFEGRNRGVCARLMEPLLRYSTPSFCEEFLSTVLENLISILGKSPRQASAHLSVERCCVDYVRALRLLRVAFQQVPKDHIESPKSILYSKMKIADKPWYLVSAVGKLCVTLRTSVKCPPDADSGMSESYRLFQCENYNALAAAVCCTSLKPAMVATVCSAAAWDHLIGDEDIELPLRPSWNQRSARHALSIEVSGELRARTLTASTMRTQAFAGTLSENVLQFDLAEPEEEIEVQELHLADNALNSHSCAATLTALLSRLSAVQAPGWRQELVSALCGARRNVKWLLAQAVCNSKEDLQPHASALRPALLDVIVTTANQSILNGLHIDILDTLIYWNVSSTDSTEHVNKTIDYIVATAANFRLNKSLYYTILEKLTKMLNLHTVSIQWDCFQTCLEDPTSDTAKCHIDILRRILQCKVYIPQVLPALTEAARSVRAVPELTALLVHAVAAATNAPRGEREEWMQWYNRVLNQTRANDCGAYIRLLYEAQKSFQNSCNDTHFRNITDLTPKVSGRARLQCVAVLAAYAEHAEHARAVHVASMFDTVGIEDLLDKREALLLIKNGLHLMEEHQKRRLVGKISDLCRHLAAKERTVAYQALLKAFELLLTKEPAEPEPKRRAGESNSVLLSPTDDYTEKVLAGVAHGLMERDGDIAKSMREGVGRCLNEDRGVRLCESFLLCVVLPSDGGQPLDGRHLARVVDLFSRRIREQAQFQRARLTDGATVEQVVPTPSIARTASTSGAQRYQDPSVPHIDAQVSMDEVFTSMLEMLERDQDAALSVVTQLIATHRAKRPGFDFDCAMSKLVMKCLCSVRTVAPWVISIAREIDIWDSPNLEQVCTELVSICRNTEGEGICRLLYEEYKIRRPAPDLFVLGYRLIKDDVDMHEVRTQFSLEDLVSCFGELSNWDELTSQRRRTVTTALPPLWTSVEDFDSSIEDDQTIYYPTWAKALVSARKNSQRNTHTWLTELQRWPRKPFDISAVTETTIWDRMRDLPAGQSLALPLHIQPADCLAEWAFRIMMRSSYLQSLSQGDNTALEKLSHSHQLQWCASANERGLHEQALLCCRSVTGLYKSETLPWLRQKLLAVRAVAVTANDVPAMRSALQSAETYTYQFRDDSSFDDVMGMNELILRLKRDVKSSRADMDAAFITINSDVQSRHLSAESIQCAGAAFVTAITFTNSLWDTCEQHEKDGLLHSMAAQLTTYTQLELGQQGALLADVILQRLAEDVSLAPETGELLEELFKLMSPQLDEVSFEQFAANVRKFSERVERNDASTHRRQLSALIQPDYQLQQYCLRLRAALLRDDADEWCRVRAAMTEAIFDNELAGADFQVLYKYKENIDAIADSSVEERRQVLTTILSELKVSEKSILYLSHLCPALARVSDKDERLARLLGLKKGVYVSKFEEKISVFVKSIRRPTLVRCLLTDGTRMRFIVKSGERARPHCAALRLLRAAQASTARRRRTGYSVTALSDDCALVQYLEQTVTLRALLGPLDMVSPERRAKDGELILSPQRAARQYADMCNNVPAYLIRSAIEATCVSAQDFIAKRKNFLQSLCDMTVLSYLYGIGDRHLENILYSIKDGGACHVDCGAILQYGGAGGELPPARLTRNVLAVCDFTVLESKLQYMLTCIRDSRELLSPAIAVSCKWLEDEKLMKKMHYATNLIKGTTLSHKVTMEVLSESDKEYKEKYVELLQQVFADFDEKDNYSVEEQVTSLLRQSTDPLILAVTRSGWEPWI